MTRAFQPVRCGLTGVGMIGTVHAEILAASAAADLVVCVDVDERAVDRVPSGVAFSQNLDDALEANALDALFVCTPQANHLADISAGLRRGLHVFTEKPLADTLDAADAIISLAADYPGRLAVGHMYRFDGRYQALVDAATDGRLGNLVHASFRGNTPDYEGQLLAGRTTLAVENAVHGLDLLRWICGDISRVYAETSRSGVTGPGLPDSLSVTMRFSSGAVGTLEFDWAMPTSTGMWSVQHFEVVGANGVGWITARDNGVGILSKSAAPSFPRFFLTARDPAGVPYGLYRMEDEYFLAGVRDGREWPISLEDARAALAAAFAIDRSLDLERPVRISEVDGLA